MDADKLMEDNWNLVYHCLNRHFRSLYFDEDIRQCGRIGLWKACLHFDESRGIKFSTFAFKCIYNEILMELRRRKRHDIERSTDYNPEFWGDNIPFIRYQREQAPDDLFDSSTIFDSLDDRERLIADLSIQGLNQSQIGKELNLSQSYISRVMTRMKKKVELALMSET